MATTTKTAKKTTKKTTAKKTSVNKTTAKKASAKSPSAKTDLKAAATRISNAQEKLVDSAESTISARISEAQENAKKAYFASLGAYGRAFEEVTTRATKASEELQNRYAKMKKDRAELIDDLVSRGEKVQDEAEARLKEGRAAVEEQIEAARERLADISPSLDIPARLKDLSNKLESLSKDLKKSA